MNDAKKPVETQCYKPGIRKNLKRGHRTGYDIQKSKTRTTVFNRNYERTERKLSGGTRGSVSSPPFETHLRLVFQVLIFLSPPQKKQD